LQEGYQFWILDFRFWILDGKSLLLNALTTVICSQALIKTVAIDLILAELEVQQKKQGL
jgi:hypothetical protein